MKLHWNIRLYQTYRYQIFKNDIEVPFAGSGATDP